MLALPAQNAIGEVVHIMMGPEGDIFQDLHGVQVMEITDWIRNHNTDSRVFLQVTRCRSENELQAHLVRGKLPCRSSITSSCADPELCEQCAAKEDCKQRAVAKESKPGAKAMVAGGKCELCGSVQPLLPIPNVKICLSCAAIELNRKPRRKEQHGKASEPSITPAP